MSKKLEWPTAIVAVAFIAAIVLIAIFADESTKSALLAPTGIVGAIVLAAMRALFGGGSPPSPPPAIVALLGVLAVSSVMSGCGASAELRGRYALEVSRCVAAEREIVEREGTTREQDEADLAAERARCDAALDAIEGSE